MMQSRLYLSVNCLYWLLTLVCAVFPARCDRCPAPAVFLVIPVELFACPFMLILCPSTCALFLLMSCCGFPLFASVSVPCSCVEYYQCDDNGSEECGDALSYPVLPAFLFHPRSLVRVSSLLCHDAATPLPLLAILVRCRFCSFAFASDCCLDFGVLSFPILLSLSFVCSVCFVSLLGFGGSCWFVLFCVPGCAKCDCDDTGWFVEVCILVR
jgi:hypothetical protein